MDITSEAQAILSSMKDFAFPVFAVVCLLLLLGVVFGRGGYTRMENLRLDAGIVVLAILLMGSLFLNGEGGKIVDIMKACPAWGLYVVLLGLVAVGVVAIEAIRFFRQDREVLSINTNTVDGGGDISESSRESRVKVFILGAVLWLLATAGAIYWLWRIGNPIP